MPDGLVWKSSPSTVYILAISCQLANTKAWSHYLSAFIRFQANELEPALHLFAQITRELHVIEPKGAVDALAGMALSQELTGQTKEADATLEIESNPGARTTVTLICRELDLG